jgi:hypothetical protein
MIKLQWREKLSDRGNSPWRSSRDGANKQFKMRTFGKIMVQNKLFHFTEVNISIPLKKSCKVERLIWVNFIHFPKRHFVIFSDLSATIIPLAFAPMKSIPLVRREGKREVPCVISDFPDVFAGFLPSQFDSVHTIPSYLSKIHFIIVHPPTSWSS